jgi:exopolyphosphatase/pppGpp-phosphohydrolase
MGPRRLAAVPGISSVRAAQLGHAAALLWALIAEVGPGEVIVSNAGLREGLLFKDRQKFST